MGYISEKQDAVIANTETPVSKETAGKAMERAYTRLVLFVGISPEGLDVIVDECVSDFFYEREITNSLGLDRIFFTGRKRGDALK